MPNAGFLIRSHKNVNTETLYTTKNLPYDSCRFVKALWEVLIPLLHLWNLLPYLRKMLPIPFEHNC